MPFMIEPIACSRMPKCSTRPYGSPGNILGGVLRREEGRLALRSWCCWTRPGRPSRPTARAAPARCALRTSPEASRVATPFSSASNVGSASAQPSGRVRVVHPVEAAPCARGWLGRPGVELLLPLGLRASPPRSTERAGVGEDVVGDVEGLRRGRSRAPSWSPRPRRRRARSRAPCRCSAALGAGQAMIVRSSMKLGWSVTALAASSAVVQRLDVLVVRRWPSLVQSTVCTCQP